LQRDSARRHGGDRGALAPRVSAPRRRSDPEPPRRMRRRLSRRHPAAAGRARAGAARRPGGAARRAAAGAASAFRLEAPLEQSYNIQTPNEERPGASRGHMAEIERLIEQVHQNFPQYDTSIIRRAYALAEKAHEGQRRRTGEPYVAHCLATASILADLHIDPPVVVAGLLHDTVEDTVVTLEQIRDEFGDEVANLVDGVTKLSQINQLTGHRDRQLGSQEAENLRKMFLAMAEDVRV